MKKIKRLKKKSQNQPVNCGVLGLDFIISWLCQYLAIIFWPWYQHLLLILWLIPWWINICILNAKELSLASLIWTCWSINSILFLLFWFIKVFLKFLWSFKVGVRCHSCKESFLVLFKCLIKNLNLFMRHLSMFRNYLHSSTISEIA